MKRKLMRKKTGEKTTPAQRQYSGPNISINNPTQRQQQATPKQTKTAKKTPKLPN